MRVLFCCQFYAPSLGGVQEVIRQIGERLASKGHQVTVATTRLPTRDFTVLNGVDIQEFSVAGNWVGGMAGEVERYQRYVSEEAFDVVLIYAAQQWTFDSLWPVLDGMRCRKVFLPCGFSGLYEPGYAKYFEVLPDILRKFDHLVFNATRYRDIDYARAHGLENFSIIPNGASESEFGVAPDLGFRARYAIPEQSFLFLTVGSFTGLKGHLELVTAFSRMILPEGRHATLILNGNEIDKVGEGLGSLGKKFVGLLKTYGLIYSLKQVVKKITDANNSPRNIANAINKSRPDKLVSLTDLPRSELTQAFMAADLFVFASNIEYSPLVLFEAAAAGTPFLTVDVGNSAEIAQWTGGGMLCPSQVDARGYTRVDKDALAKSMTALMHEEKLLGDLGATGKRNWLDLFTWKAIADQYEELFYRLRNEDNKNS